jgi:amide synthase
MDLDTAYDRCVAGRRGGICLQLNRLFARLLSELGFNVSLLTANTHLGDAWFEYEIEHMLLRATLGDDEWLVDVGFPGPSYLEPLLICDRVQEQYASQFRLVPDGDLVVVERRGRDTSWSKVYRLRLKERQLADWDDTGGNWWAFGSESAQFGQMTLMGRAFGNGQATLHGRRLLTVIDGREQVSTVVQTKAYESVLEAFVGSADLYPADLRP